jgi:misacylated tRNA(Ala) deacylase
MPATTGARPFYHLHPDVLDLDAEVVDAGPGRVLLSRSPFHPGGGGQLADRGLIRWDAGEARVTGFERSEQGTWHLLAGDAEPSGAVRAAVDERFRRLMCELHTGTHVLNAFVFQHFDGALVTGVQMMEDASARMDFDLPDADNDRLRALESELNDVIRQDLRVSDDHVDLEAARAQHGLIRSRSVAPPPTADGLIRVVEIAGLDRQACGGTHLASTGSSHPLRVLKVENKGRHNRRVRVALVGFPGAPDWR